MPTTFSDPKPEEVYRTSNYPSPNYKHVKGQRTMPAWEITEDIVISGISGRFPEADTMEEFREHLMSGMDMIIENDSRWPIGLFGLPARQGKMKDISKFDATYFGIHAKQADTMDPQARMVLEATYEAIVDAGVNPHSLRGGRIGVFLGGSNTETEVAMTQEVEKNSGYLLLGCCRALFANRISFVFDLQGPSIMLDTACSSSLVALDQAMQSMRCNQCDAAVVTGINLSIDPINSTNFQKLGMLSMEGKCNAFDANVTGYVRSEAVGVIFLQKASDAKRIYATVVHTKSNADGYKEQGITYPSGAVQKKLLEETYQEAGIYPADAEYVEAHGTGTVAGDFQEINGITDVFCKDRVGPLLIGSVKSNMGHAESASGMCSLAKIVIAMESGLIPANIHYRIPNPDIPGLLDGRLKVITEHTPYKGGLVSISNYGFGGANGHVILKPNPIGRKQGASPKIEGPKLFNFSGRTEASVSKVLTYMEEHAEDHHLYSLLAEPALSPLGGHPYRGYTIFNSDTPVKEIRRCSSNRPPIWYVYPGMGTQWTGMGRDLMKIEIFHDTVMRIHEILKPHGIDMYKLIMEGDETTFDEILNSFVVIACIQIALTNILRHVGIEPDGMVGHSVGELGCAYADGCFSEEEMIMSAYWRGWHVKNSDLPPGAMAAVGLTWEDATQRCPEGVVPACHNAEDSVTISGAAQLVNGFVKELKTEGKFAKEVNSSGFAFHCHYMAGVAPGLKKALEKTIPNPKPRTSRWASSSIPEPRWGTALAQTSSAAYFVNNLVSPVLFHAGVGHIPKNALVIEVAPHSLLQAVLKRTLGPECTFFGLMKRNQVDSISYLLSTLGKLYVSGLNPSVANLYPAASRPAPRGTPMVSPLIEWDHSQSWAVAKPEKFIKKGLTSGAQMVVEVDISSPDSNDSYLVGHTIDGRVLYPATGYLVLAWKGLASLRGKEYTKMPVVMEDVMLHRATILPKTGVVKLQVTIMAAGQFEISEGGNAVVTGKIYEPEDPSLQYADDLQAPVNKPTAEVLHLKTKDIYKELRLIGYEYGPTFQGILESDNEGTRGKLKWNGNWVTFLDTVLQFSILGMPSRNLRLPTGLQNVRINPEYHENAITSLETDAEVPVVADRLINVCVSGGVELVAPKANMAPRRPLQQSPPVLEEHHFVPFVENNVLNARDNTEQQIKHYTSICTDYIIQKTKNLISQGATFLLNPALLADIAKRPTKLSNIDQVVEDYLAKTTLNATLLKVLREIFTIKPDNDFKPNVENILNQCVSDLHDDSLLAALLNRRIIKTCLDLVQENTTSGKIKLVEAGAVKGNMFPKFVAIINSKPLAQVDCTATDVNPDQLSSPDLEQYNVKSTKWDFTSDSAPRGTDGAHLVFASGVLASNTNSISNCLQNLTSALREGGFLLLLERTKECMAAHFLDAIREVHSPIIQRDILLKAFQAEGLEVIAEKADGILSSLFLLRKINSADAKVSVVAVEEGHYERWVEKIKQKLIKVQQPGTDERLWLVAHDTATNGIIGMINCLRQEGGGDKIRCIFNPNLEYNKVKQFETDPVKALKSIYGDQVRKDLVSNVFRDGAWGSYRHIPLKNDDVETIETNCAYVNILSRGDLASLRWIESPLKHHSSNDETICHVYYSALNFRDIMLASGKLVVDATPGDLAFQDSILGFEYSGKDGLGNRIMGLIPSKALATTLTIARTFAWDVPDHWTLEEAATIPVVYATVYYAYFVRGGLKKGETVLIHAGSGGIGQAAIAVALHLGCEVFTTVSTKEKKDFLKKLYPQLKDENFANSRDTTFERVIMRATGGRGVDVVLNSLAEDKLIASVRLLAEHGRFLEIGKYDFSKNNPLGMEVFLKNIAFHGILFDTLFYSNAHEKKIVFDLMDEGIKAGVVKPMCRTVFEKDQVEEAFRYMAAGKHIGKVLVKIRDEEPQHVKEHRPLKLRAIPYTSCHPKKSYVVTGGLGGFGLELCYWLVERGARQLVLSSRSGIRDGYQSRCIRHWRENGVRVIVSKNDVATQDGAVKLLTEAKTLGPVGGIFNLAMVLKDGFMENQTVENYVTVCTPKVNGTHHLDNASRKMCPDLDYFVAFSSVSCGHGNAGQSNYGFANSVMERICELRKKDGLPGLAIQWGAIGDVGFVQESMGGNDLVVGGTLPQRIISCMSTLDRFLNQPHTVVSSYVLAERQGQRADAGKRVNLVDMIANILGIKDIATVSPDLTLGDMGMDSLMGVEIKQALERDFNAILSINDIRQLSIKMLDVMNSGEEISSSPTDNQESNKGKEAIAKVPRFDYQNLVPKQCVVPLNTVTKGQPFFIVHPIEGGVIVLNHLASKITFPVYGIQCTSETPLETLEDLAAYYIKQIRAVQPKGPYRISGYSFGASVAFEMGIQLQKENPNNPDIAQLIMFDGSHDIISSLMEGYRVRLQMTDVTQLEVDALCTFLLQFIAIEYTEVKADVLNIPSWAAKLDHVANTLMKTGLFSNREDIKAAAASFHKKVVAGCLYAVSTKFAGKLTLFRAKQNTTLANLGHDYGLGQVCSSEVTVHAVDGDHDTLILGHYGDKCAEIVNAILGQ